jgi:hypothetical protein
MRDTRARGGVSCATGSGRRGRIFCGGQAHKHPARSHGRLLRAHVSPRTRTRLTLPFPGPLPWPCQVRGAPHAGGVRGEASWSSPSPPGSAAAPGQPRRRKPQPRGARRRRPAGAVVQRLRRGLPRPALRQDGVHEASPVPASPDQPRTDDAPCSPGSGR